MDELEKFNQTTLAKKEEFYSNLNLENVADADYMHEKRVWKGFEIKNLVEYHDLYFKGDTLLLVDFFKNFKKLIKNLSFKFFKVFFSSRISMASCFKKM